MREWRRAPRQRRPRPPGRRRHAHCARARARAADEAQLRAPTHLLDAAAKAVPNHGALAAIHRVQAAAAGAAGARWARRGRARRVCAAQLAAATTYLLTAQPPKPIAEEMPARRDSATRRASVADIGGAGSELRLLGKKAVELKVRLRASGSASSCFGPTLGGCGLSLIDSWLKSLRSQAQLLLAFFSRSSSPLSLFPSFPLPCVAPLLVYFARAGCIRRASRAVPLRSKLRCQMRARLVLVLPPRPLD